MHFTRSSLLLTSFDALSVIVEVWLLSYFSIQFVKRQANRPAHCLARAARSHASSFISFSISSILEDTLLANLLIS